MAMRVEGAQILAAPQGFEPRYADPELRVNRGGISGIAILIQSLAQPQARTEAPR